MLKSLGVLASGIFIGALGVEAVRRGCPSCDLDKLYAKAGELKQAVREAFMEGYTAALNPEKPEPVES